MPSLPILPGMPMKAAADEAAGVPDSINLPPLPMPPPGAAGATPALPPAMPPMPMTPPPMSAAPMGPQGMAPAPMSPEPPYQALVQNDGTILAYVDDPSAPDGKRYLGIHKAIVPPKTAKDKGAQGPQMDFSRAAMPQMQ